MSLTSGTRLGPYEITSAIGVGGMGEVYRARDTRLDRTVAIKVLPSTFAEDPVLDIFALGAVLYEMLSGARAFEGDSSANVIAAIMTGAARRSRSARRSCRSRSFA